MREQTRCPKCKSKKVGENSIYDDWDGMITCLNVKCKYRFKRWIGGGSMNTKRKYLLLGGSGILGAELQKNQELYDIQYSAPSSCLLDIEEEDVMGTLSLHKDLLSSDLCGIVHCAAYTDVPGAETPEGRKRAISLNIFGTQNVSFMATVLGVPMVYISTDYVYPGDRGNYKEEDIVRPINYYAMTKLAGEAFASDNDVVIRTSFKPNIPWPHEKAFNDLYTSADYVDVIADKINWFLGYLVPDHTGIFNIGTERKSIYELARRRNTKIKSMSRKGITNVNLPSDVSMNIDKFNKAYEYMYNDE